MICNLGGDRNYECTCHADRSSHDNFHHACESSLIFSLKNLRETIFHCNSFVTSHDWQELEQAVLLKRFEVPSDEGQNWSDKLLS